MTRSITKLIALSVSTLALAACQQADAPEASEETAAAETEKAAWGYGDADGPAKWGDLSEDYAMCKTGKEQSPIDLPTADKATTTTVSGNYGPTKAKIVNKGYTVQADFEESFKLTSGDKEYGLVQVHMHTPSENTVDGKAFPLTGHFVHTDADGNLAVLGVMFSEGEPNAQIQAMLDNLDGEADLDISAMMPSDMTVYNFAGSLTTPPCSEGVNWHVLTTPITASKEQIEALNKSMGNNARPVQPLNDRVL